MFQDGYISRKHLRESLYIYMKISSTGTVNKEFSFYDFEIMYCFDKGNQREKGA